MARPSTFLVFGGTGGTGRHFVPLALSNGHRVKALARDPAKFTITDANLEVHQGSITDITNTEIDNLTRDVDFVVIMLGDLEAQKESKINTAFVQKLVPAMRQHGVKRLLYQAGGFTRPYEGWVSPILWLIRSTMARGFDGQHQDNEAVMKYLSRDASDIEWIVHRAGISGDGPSKGSLRRSSTLTTQSVGTFRDCASYSYHIIQDSSAVHTSDYSTYNKS